MLTEKHNVAGVRELIYGMVNTSDEKHFRAKAVEFMQAFAAHVGAKYEKNAFIDAFDELSYWNLGERYSLGIMDDEFDLEFGLFNTLTLLSFYCGGEGDGMSDFINFDDTTKTLQGGDGADFLFTANHIAKELKKKYLSVASYILNRLEKEKGEEYSDEEEIDEVQNLLKNRIKEAEGIKFHNAGVMSRQQHRKQAELYGTGARTKRGWYYDENGKKQPVPQSYRDIVRKDFDPFSRNKGRTDVW